MDIPEDPDLKKFLEKFSKAIEKRYVEVNKKILKNDQYVPPRKNLIGRVGIIVRNNKKYPSVQFYICGRKDPSLPQKVPRSCLTLIPWDVFMGRGMI